MRILLNVLILLLPLIGCAKPAAQAVAKPAAQPNILLIVADDLGYSDLGCYGGEIDTPNLDTLAKQGVRFTEFHVNPMCMVTRTSLMSGHTHSQSDKYLRSLPIANLMKQAGYSTSISGKWHQPGNPLDAGFDSFYGFLKGQIDSWTGWQQGGPTIQTNREEPKDVPEGWYSTDAFTDHAIAQIDKLSKRANRSLPTWHIMRPTVRCMRLRKPSKNTMIAIAMAGTHFVKNALNA